MNQVALVGNITDDPELRYTQSGAALAGFTVAVSHRSKTNGEWQDVNDGFFRCTVERASHEARLRPGFVICKDARQLEGQWSGNLEYDVITLIPVEEEATFF